MSHTTSGYENPTDISSKLFGLDLFQTENKSSQWLIDNGFGSNLSVYSIINKVVTAAIDVDLIIKDQNNEVVESGQLFEKLQNPAIYQGESIDKHTWIEYALTFLLSTGNLYQKKERLFSTSLIDLEIIPSGIILPKKPNSYFQSNLGFKVQDKSRWFDLGSDDVNHTKYINPTKYGLNTLVGLSPLQAGLFVLSGSTDIQQAWATIVKNQGARGVLSNDSDRPSNNSTWGKSMKNKLKGLISGTDKFNSVVVTGTKVSYTSIGSSPADLKLIESGVLTDRQLCNMYGFSSRLLNDPNASTYNNIVEDTKTLYTNAVIPALNKVVGSFNNTVAKDFNKTSLSQQRVVIDTSRIESLQQDKKREAEKDRLNAMGYSQILSSQTDRNGKVEQLISIYDMPEEQAIKIVGNGTNEGAED